jgi:hypothetical protein
MEEDFLDRHDDRELRRPSLDRHLVNKPSVPRDERGATDAKRLRLARDQEEEADMRGAEQVRERNSHPVARPLGDGQCGVVENAHEPGGIALRGDVQLPSLVR